MMGDYRYFRERVDSPSLARSLPLPLPLSLSLSLSSSLSHVIGTATTPQAAGGAKWFG